MEGWTSALDKQEVATDLVLRNEEEIPILKNYLPDVLAINKGWEGGGGVGRRLKRKLHILEMRIQKFKVEVPGRGGGLATV